MLPIINIKKVIRNDVIYYIYFKTIKVLQNNILKFYITYLSSIYYNMCNVLNAPNKLK